MARLRSTARVEREGGEVEGAETVPISEAMQRSRLVTSERIPTAETAAETEQAAAEAERGDIEEISQYQASLVIWTSGNRLSPRRISPRW
jgi:hypothetical protein